MVQRIPRRTCVAPIADSFVDAEEGGPVRLDRPQDGGSRDPCQTPKLRRSGVTALVTLAVALAVLVAEMTAAVLVLTAVGGMPVRFMGLLWLGLMPFVSLEGGVTTILL